MEVIDFFKGHIRGRKGNMMFVVRNDKLHIKRYAIPGKPRKWEEKGRTTKQQEVTTRFTAVQWFYREYMKQVSPDVWRAAAKPKRRTAPNLFHSTNARCFNGQGELVDFENFVFTQGTLALPRNLQVTREGNHFRVTWQEERHWTTTARTDTMQVGILYDNLQRSPRLAPNVKGCRGDLQGEFTLDERLGTSAHVYIFFAGNNGTDFSASWHARVEL